MRAAILSMVFTLGTMGATAQFTIIDGWITTCNGGLSDSGGENGPGYFDNEDYVLVICPEFAGSAVTLEWPSFNLSTAGSTPTDRIIIYDGDAITAPVLGTWSGTDNPGIVSATFDNPTGCLTVEFISNETGTTSFFANISCIIPCDPPTPIVTVAGHSTFPALVCQGESIAFDATASTSAATIAEYRWDFADGAVDTLSGALATYAYTVPGAYTVQLTLTDENDCSSTQFIDLQFLVSTTPDFSASTFVNSVICLGESVILDATGVVAVPWTGIPIADFGEGIYLPDNQSQPFISNLTFEGFQPGATISSVDQVLSVCVSMEHSYMGDLQLSVVCPNGQLVMLHSQGGTNTFIGDALDTETVPPTPGICLDYCWTMSAPNGTFAESSFNGVSPHTQPATIEVGQNVLIPDDYTPLEPFDQLVGCPLNGVWQFVARDLLGIDDGFVCSWSIQFDPALYPDLTTYTPILGTNSLDSASWTGQGVATDPQTPLVALATPTEEGDHTYTFTVTDNFGCSYDTTVNIFVNPGIVAPVLITGNAQFCEGSIAYLNAPPGYTAYEWSNGSVGANISVFEPGVYTVTVYSGDCSLPSEPFTVTTSPAVSPVIQGPPTSCGGEPATLSTTEEYANYLWSNASTDGSITVGTGTYTVTVTSAAGCSGTSAPYPVTIGSDPQAAFVADPPPPQGIGTTVNFTDTSVGNGSPVTSWSWDLGIVGEGANTPNTSFTYDVPGTYNVTLTVTTADGCESMITLAYTIRPQQIIIPNVFTPNSDGKNDNFVIENGQYYDNTLAIYNRWGQVVFEKNNYQNTWGGSGVVDGTYYYVFTTVEDNKEYTGHVTILR